MSTPTVVDPAHVPHLVNGLSLEITRQADRIRRRSHSRDWPGAASAMAELEEAVDLLTGLVNCGLRASMAPVEVEAEEPDEIPVPAGVYL